MNLHGASPWHPRAGRRRGVAASVNLHGASRLAPWIVRLVSSIGVATSVNFHGAARGLRNPTGLPVDRLLGELYETTKAGVIVTITGADILWPL